MKASVQRDLETILRSVERLERAFGVDDVSRSGLPDDDEQMRYLLGGIRVNAEDALGALQAEDRLNHLHALFGLPSARI